MRKIILDKRICNIVKGSKNKETGREFIRNSEEYFGLDGEDINNMNISELYSYIDMLNDFLG